jgi:hypothetical protein
MTASEEAWPNDEPATRSVDVIGWLGLVVVIGIAVAVVVGLLSLAAHGSCGGG